MAIRNVLGRIGVQVGLCAALFVVVLCMLGWTSHQGFAGFRTQTNTLALKRVPDLRQTSALVAEISALPQGFAQLLQASDRPGVVAARDALLSRIDAFSQTSQSESSAEMAAHFAKLRATLDALAAAVDFHSELSRFFHREVSHL